MKLKGEKNCLIFYTAREQKQDKKNKEKWGEAARCESDILKFNKVSTNTLSYIDAEPFQKHTRAVISHSFSLF